MEKQPGHPVWYQLKHKLASLLAAASDGFLTEAQACESLEEAKADGFDFSFPMLRLKKYAPNCSTTPDALFSMADKWKAQVRHFHQH